MEILFINPGVDDMIRQIMESTPGFANRISMKKPPSCDRGPQGAGAPRAVLPRFCGCVFLRFCSCMLTAAFFGHSLAAALLQLRAQNGGGFPQNKRPALRKDP